MKKILFGLIATLFISNSVHCQVTTMCTSELIKIKSNIEIPQELKSAEVYSLENANEFVSLSIYLKEYDSFVTAKFSIKDDKIAVINLPEKLISDKNITVLKLSSSIFGPRCYTWRCFRSAMEDWLFGH